MSVESLSAKQTAVFEHLVEGLSNKEIADKLNRSPATVDRHVNDIFKKLGCTSRSQLIVRHYKGEL